MTIEQARQELTELQRKLAAYGHAVALISYDGVTGAPKGTAKNRAETLGVLSGEIYKLSTGEESVALLEFLDEHKDELSDAEKRIVFLMLKSVREMRKIPMDEYVEFQTLLAEADDAWHRAKEDNDFPLFEPYLEKLFDTQKRFAGYCAPEKNAYDYWLNEFEEGLTREKCDEFFTTLRGRIVPLLKKISEKPQIDDSILKGTFPEAKQEEFAHYLMELIGIDMDHCGLATTEHPFTTELGSHEDVRITTNYHESNFASSMYSVIHEGGHALYELGVSDDYYRTSLDGGVSMGIHESQSRFYENILGRSRAFSEFVFPKLCEIFPDQMKGHTAEELYRALNRAEPSLIRIEADELTYALHIMVRYEAEKRVMDGEVAVHDLPALWNSLYKEYLGVDVPDDKHGVLQDSHWSGGAIGYFPSYALGSAYGAQLLRKMQESVDVFACIAKGDFAPINEWNRANIWSHGSMYKPGELLEKALGEKFDPTVFADYLEAKFSELYDL